MIPSKVTSVDWSWKPEWSATILSNNGLTSKDSGDGKAWTTSVALTPIPPGAGYYYYEIKVDFCNLSNSIKIVFGILTSSYLNGILKREVGKMGSLKGGCPIGYFPQFGKGTLCYFANGQIYRDGAEVCKADSFGTNDTIGMCVDTHTNSISFYKNHRLVGQVFQGIIAHLYNTDSEDDHSMHQDLYPAVSLIKENIVSIVRNPSTFESPPQLPPTMPSNPFATTTTSPTTNSTTTSTSTTSTTSTNHTSLSPINLNHPAPSQSPVVIVQSNSLESPIKSSSSSSQLPNHSNYALHNLKFPNNSNNNNSNSGSTPKHPPTPPLTSDPGNTCPVCGISLSSVGKDWVSVNKHIDECLTFSLLDNEQGPKPFSIMCPYPNCKKPSQLSKDFVSHCNDSHFLELTHNHMCPLCNTNTPNLISHLSKNHINIPTPKKESFVGVGYSTNVLDHDLGNQECPVCLDEFYKGQSVARLECWCVFHVDCISAYLLKSKKCPVHT